MFNKKSSRPSLALFVALALGSGAFLAPSAADAADVSGQNVTIDDTHAPSNNATDPNNSSNAIGTAAGFIGNVSDNGNVTNNTLTFNGRPAPPYDKPLFGGLTFGTGNVTGNRIIVNPATGTLLSTADGIFGGLANGGGNVEDNHAVFNGNQLNGDLVGGMAKDGGTGIVKGNTATLKGGNANKDIYGGIAANDSNGDVIENKVRIEGGTVTSPTGTIYGGYSEGTGAVKGNTVTITGGIMQTVYGGYSTGSGEVSGNTVNLGDGTAAMAAGYAINGKLIGGKNTTDANKVSNNTLNVNTNAKAYNIENFSTINFNFNAYTNTTQSLLTLTDTAKTKLQSLKQLHVKNAQVGKGTLMENANGIDVAESGTVGRTEEKTETLIQKDGTSKIAYRTYQFKDSTALDTDGTDVWGGRSRAGNATTGNNVTLNGNYSGNAYGGWTTKIATTVTGESEKNHSKDNRITLEGTTSQVQNMKGGATSVDGGDATGNHAILNAGTVNGHLTGGESVKGNAKGNFVDINGGTVQGDTTGGAAGNAGKAESNEVTITGGTLNGDAHGGKTWDGDAAGNTVKLTGGTTEKVYGGYSKSAGKATRNIVQLSGSASALDVYGGYAKSNDTEHNTVEISGGTARSVYGGESDGAGKAKDNTANLTGGTLTGDIFGGSAKNGDAVTNHVNITGGSAAGHDAYGGFSTNGNATGNTVNITGGSVRNVDGGRSLNGNATGNTVTIGRADTAFTGSILGIISGGSGTNGVKDYRTGNTLNVHSNVSAANISNFAEINFHFHSHVNQSTSFLTLSDVGGTTIHSLSDLKINGEHGRKGTLLKNTGGTITISDGNNRLVKTNENKELVLAKSSDNKQIDYEGYAFAHQTAPTRVTDGGTTNTWGGRSIGGNSTRHNEITVTSDNHDNIYGGWTAGSGTTATDKDNSYKNVVTLDGSGATTGNLYGGYVDTDAGKAEENTVTVKNGTVNTAVYGGVANKVAGTGYVKKNKVNISGGTVSNVYGGYSAGSGDVLENEVTATGGTLNGSIHGGYSTSGAANENKVTLGAVSTGAVTGGRGATAADGNEVTLTGTTVTGDVKGGEGATTKKNIVNLNGGVTINGALKGGTGTPGATGEENKLNVKGTNSAQSISDFQKLHFDTTGATAANPLLNVTGGATNLDWNTLDASGTSVNRTTLLKNANGINLSNYTAGTVKSKINEAGTTEYNIDVAKTGTLTTDITYQGYQFKGKKTATTEGTDTYGGRSKAGNTTTENELTVDSGSHTNIYGGWTSGAGSTADAAKQKDSTNNKATVKGAATATGAVYGGLTEVAGGKATGNTVTVKKDLAANIIGGKAASGEASGNTVNLSNTTVNSVTGGDGTTTNNNKVNLNGSANVTGALKGGIAANGTGNTLNVKGVNSAGTIAGFQKLHFDTTGASTTNPLLNITGGATNLDWNTLDASGTSVNRTTLLKNANGINLSNHTPGTVKSKINEAGTTEYNIDVAKTSGTVTDITYQGYQFKGKTTATTEGSDTYGGRSKAGNTTTENDLTVDSGSHTNIYGGWTSGAGSTADAAKQKDSIDNKVTVKGTAAATGAVYGGLTDVAGGKATGNTVTVEKDLAATNIIGGKAASGEASGNTVNLANATVNSVTGGDGTTTNNNTVNLNGSAQVTGALKGGSQASGTDNTLKVKGKNNKAGSIENIQKMNFNATGLAKDDTMLEDTNAAGTNVDWANLKASGTAAKPLTLLKNTHGIHLAGYTGAAKSETGETTETNIDVRKTGTRITEITYEGYQFKSVTQATTVTEGAVTDTFGGRSKAGNSTRENTVEVASGTHTNVYGGWTSGSGSTATDKDNSYKNKITVKGSATVSGTVYGGYTEAASGNATENTVTVEKDLNANIIGGKAAAEASDNTVNLANATVNSVTGGEGATTNNNIVNLKGNAQVTGALKGGAAANGTGNTLKVTGTNNKAGSISGFQKLTFDTTNTDANPMLQVTGGAATDVDWTNLTATGAASETPKTLMENAAGINTSGRVGDTVKSELNADATMETNIDVVKSGSTVTKLVYEGYTFKGSTKTTTYGADTWAGRSKAGNTTQDNKLTLDDASKTYANVYGGWTSGTGTKAAADKQNNSLNNTVDYTAGTLTGTLYGGYAATGEASGNTVNLGAIQTAANIYGGFGAVTKNNTINLKGARVTGTVTGGSAGGTGNTLAVYKPSEVHDFAGVQNLHFYTDEMAAGSATPMLKLGTATKDIRGLNIGVARSGAAPKLNKGDKILLMKTAGGALTTDAAIPNKVEGMQGVSRRYEYEIKQEATGELTATVTKAGFAEQAKSLVETRAGLAGFVNQGADYLVQNGLAAAQMSVSTGVSGKSAQRKAAASDSSPYHLWAGLGANSMRAESGSHVDSKGWNLGIGWAREDAKKDGSKVLFSPFVEYGHGTYDSYLDDGTHGSGKISYIGAGILGKLTQKDGLWLEGSARAGHAKSDYSANLSGTAANYDGSNTYYGVHLGAGKTFAVKEDSSIDAYARWFWSHQNSMTATLNTGDRYEFGSVNSQRLRLGLRYSLKDKKTGEFYAGLAWEHEFAGKAGATYEGDAAPSPSLKGSSYMLELGYRFMPENSRVSYDLHLNGWQGKRKGITGGASIKWAF